MESETLETSEEYVMPKKKIHDLIPPLFVVAKSVENLKRKFGNNMDKETKTTFSNLEKAIAEMLDTLDKLRMP